MRTQDLIQPILPAIDTWITIFSRLPYAINSLVGLSVGLFFGSRLVILLFKQ